MLQESWGFLLGGVLRFLFIGGLIASSLAHAGLVGERDHRRLLQVQGTSWAQAIGRLSTGCTGTLISEEQILTSAHCVVDPSNSHRVVENLQFHLPLEIAARSARVEALGTWDPAREVASDWAILRLEKPVPSRDAEPLPILHGTELKARRVSLVGFAVDRDPTRASIHSSCELLGWAKVDQSWQRRSSTGVLEDRCDSGPGESGGPLLAYDLKGRVGILGIHHGGWSPYSNAETWAGSVRVPALK